MAAQGVLEFRSNRLVKVAVGLATGFMALFNFAMFAAAGDQAGFLGLIGIPLAVVSVAAFGYHSAVRIDPRTGRIEKEFGLYAWAAASLYELSDFESVGLATGGRRSASGGSSTVYIVQLVGPRQNLSLPGAGSSRADALARAEEVADATGLRLDPEPRVALFGKRL
jgi:hypothetical protein